MNWSVSVCLTLFNFELIIRSCLGLMLHSSAMATCIATVAISRKPTGAR